MSAPVPRTITGFAISASLLLPIFLVPSIGRAQADQATLAKSELGTLTELPTNQRLAAANSLAKLNPTPIEFFAETLARPRSSTDAERRDVLASIEAAVPDDKGVFAIPERSTQTKDSAADAFDWLSALNETTAATTPETRAAWKDAFVDVAVLRALARSTDPKAAEQILGFAFTEAGLIYRDECGRQLRAMAPISIPALILGTENTKGKSMARYATYQLERLDRQNPNKAFAAAGSESLKIAVLEAFAQAQYREGVYTVLDQVNHLNPRVRKAARDAWTEYISGRAPPDSPKRKLELPGGKLTDEEVPLWLNHRQLADVAVRKRLQELTGEKSHESATLVELTESLYHHYDQARIRSLDGAFERAQELAASGKLPEAVAIYDQILVQQPTFARRNVMFSGYVQYAAALEQNQSFADAARAYGAASAVADDPNEAQEALAKHHFARAKATEATGKDASTEFAMARQHQHKLGGGRGQRLFLFAGIGLLAMAILFLILGLRKNAGPQIP